MGVFSLCFGETAGGVIGNPTTFWFYKNVDGSALTMPDGSVLISGIPGLTFAGYQGMFAVITPALMTGAFADRLRFAPYLVFVALWIVFVYAPWCHWIWGPGGWLGAWGVKDFAGGIVVHTTAGFSALAACQFLGSRAKVRIPTRQTHVSPQTLRPSDPQTLRPSDPDLNVIQMFADLPPNSTQPRADVTRRS